MNFNKVAIYGRVGNRNQLLSNPILYASSKDKEEINRQLGVLTKYCESNETKISKKIFDIGGSNFYKNKLNLQKIINTNKNTDIMIYKLSILGRNSFDTLSIYEECKEKNIKIYSMTDDRFLEEMFEIKKEEKDMEM